jgi:hypothetical protein
MFSPVRCATRKPTLDKRPPAWLAPPLSAVFWLFVFCWAPGGGGPTLGLALLGGAAGLALAAQYRGCDRSWLGVVRLFVVVWVLGHPFALVWRAFDPAVVQGVFDERALQRALAVSMLFLSAYMAAVHCAGGASDTPLAAKRWLQVSANGKWIPWVVLAAGGAIVSATISAMSGNPIWIQITDDPTRFHSSSLENFSDVVSNALTWWAIGNCLAGRPPDVSRALPRRTSVRMLTGYLLWLVLAARDVLGSSKVAFVITVVQLLVLQRLLGRKIRARMYLVAAVVLTALLPLLYPLQMAYRSQLLLYQDASMQKLSMARKASIYLEAFGNATGDSTGDLESNIQNVVRRFSYMEQLSTTVVVVPAAIPYDLWGSLRDILNGFIPRFLWPGKPVLSRGIDFNDIVMGRGAMSNNTPAFSGELFMMGGLLAVIVGGYCFGLIQTGFLRFLGCRGGGNGAHLGCVIVVSLLPALLSIGNIYYVPIHYVQWMVLALGLGMGVRMLEPLLGRRGDGQAGN